MIQSFRELPAAENVSPESFEDTPPARDRLSRFFALEHPILPTLLDVELSSGRIRVIRRRRDGTPLWKARHSRETAAAVFLQACSAILFFGSRGFSLETADFDDARVEIWNGSPHLWLPASPRSASREPVSPEPPAATMSALLTRLLARRRGAGAVTVTDRAARALLETLIARMTRVGRPDAWMVEILRSFPFLLREPFASVRKRCAGFCPAGFDEREREHRARALLGRLRLAGKRARLFLPGRSALVPGEALRASLGQAANEADLAQLRLAVSEAAAADTHWIALEPEEWDASSSEIFSSAVRAHGLEVMEIHPAGQGVRPDELRDAVWIPAPDLAASVELYGALHAALSRNPQSLRRGVSRFLSSAQFGAFIDAGAVPEFLREADPDQAFRDLASLTRDERRAAGIFLVNPSGATAEEIDRLAGGTGFSGTAAQLAAAGWLFEAAQAGQWRVTDPSARADLLSTFSPEEVNSFVAVWLPEETDPIRRAELAARAGRLDLIRAEADRIFPVGPPQGRRRELDAIARLILQNLRDESPPAVKHHEADRLAELGDHARAKQLWESSLAGAAAGPLQCSIALALARHCQRIGDRMRSRELWKGIASNSESPGAARAAAFRGLACLALSAGEIDSGLKQLACAAAIVDLPLSERLENALVEADVEYRRGNVEREKEIYDSWRAAVRAPGLEDLQLRFLMNEGMFLSDRRDHAGAALRFAEALAAAGDDAERRGRALIDLAISSHFLGDAPRAEACFLEAEREFDRSGNSILRRSALANLGSLYLEQRRYTEAGTLLEKLLSESEESGDEVGRLTARSHRARLHLRLGRFPAAARDRREAFALCERLADRVELAELEIEESDGRLFEGDREGALRFARQSASRPADRGPSREKADRRVRELEAWSRGGDPSTAFVPDEMEEEFRRDPVEASRSVARARAFFGEEFERACPELCARAREELSRAGEGAFADSVLSRPPGHTKDTARLRLIRERLSENAVPLRVLDCGGAEVWRAADFRDATWSREILAAGRRYTLEGHGPDADETAFLFETLWSPTTEAPSGAESGAGLAVCRDAGIVTADASMEALGIRLSRVAPLNVTVFISGESGTGKEKVARAVHQFSPRASYPFVAVNVAAIPEPLLESELFGHVRGAFSGADRERTGLFEAADRGSLFLDEIGDLPAALQGKLLRALQEREVRRVGDNRSRPVDVRLISATARSLEKEVEAGRFREDLYYRIKVATLELPPLRRRGADVSLLARHFLQKYATEFRKGDLKFTAAAAARLRAHPWPGNVRQLQNAVMEAVALALEGDEIDVGGLPEFLQAGQGMPEAGNYRERVDEFRRRVVLEALARNRGNRTHAAKELGLTRQALLYLIRELAVLEKARA